MPIPKTRKELMELVCTTFAKLEVELESSENLAMFPCIDDWKVKDLLAVRAWWTEKVVEWIQIGQNGDRLPQLLDTSGKKVRV